MLARPPQQHKGKKASWGKTRQNLLQAGTLSRFRLGTVVQREPPRTEDPRQQDVQRPVFQAQAPPVRAHEITQQIAPTKRVTAQAITIAAALNEDDTSRAEAEEMPYVPSQLLRTVLDTYRREVLASYPRVVKGPELEVLDECEPSTLSSFHELN